VTVATAQQPTDWLAGDLAQDVPHGDVNSADGVSERPAAAHPERIGVQLLANAFWFQRIFTHIQWFEYVQGGMNQRIIGEDRSPSRDAFIGINSHERVHTILRLDLRGPTALWCAAAQACRFDFHNFHDREVSARARCAHPCAAV